MTTSNVVSAVDQLRILGGLISADAVVAEAHVGLGSVTFHTVTRTAKDIEVVMLEIRLSQSIAGLPTDTVVQVAGANAVVNASS